MMRFSMMLPAMLLAAGAGAQTTADPYAPSRAIIADIQRIVTPNGVQESFAAELGGTRQWITVRGSDRANPIILFVHGGPAAPETPVAWTFQRPWEDFFTVVQWDQRASGKSFPLNDPAGLAPTLTVDRYTDDAIALIEQLTARYGKRKVILMGHSWGTIVGLSVARKRPDLLHAYVGMGQVIDFRENERVGFERILEAARKDGNQQAIKELEALRPYPAPGPFDPKLMTIQRKWSIHYGFLSAGRNNAAYYFTAPRLSPEYGPADLKAWGDGSNFTIANLLPKLADISFMDLRRLETPTYMFLGRHDFTTPSPVTARWIEALKAPKKGVVWFENSAHLPMVEEPGHVFAALLRYIRPLAEKSGDGKASGQ